MVSLLDHHEGDARLVAILQFGARLTHLTQLVLKHLGKGRRRGRGRMRGGGVDSSIQTILNISLRT